MDNSRQRMCLWTEGLIAPLLAILLIGCGSGDPANSKDDAPTANGGESSKSLDIVNRMIQRYHDAKSYTNQGEIKITYADGFKRTERMSISFARPNRLSFELSGVHVRCNGNTYSASIHDSLTNDLRGQVLHRLAPRELTAENYLPDRVLQGVVENRARSTKRLYLTPLFLLLDAEDYSKEVRSFAKKSKLDNATIDGKPCYRLTSKSMVLWIDQQEYLLRRIDVPDEKTPVSAEFTGARFADKISNEVFDLLSVETATTVGNFVQPPRHIPVELLGKRPDPFKFTDLEGNEVSQQGMDGRVNVLLWCIDDPHCQTALRALSEMRRNYSTEEVRFFVVWLDPQLVDTRAIRDRFNSLATDLSLVIDPHEYSKEVFRVSHAPTLLVLDSKLPLTNSLEQS
ncbi:MAG: hypothetical protein IH991_14220 [Planctomycetes bacterium]|nr:hypothetical protein [Planctomycetota bacterium]